MFVRFLSLLELSETNEQSEAVTGGHQNGQRERKSELEIDRGREMAE